MANAALLMPFILKWEGGFSNHPADRGGATNKGITLATYADYRRRKGITPTTADDLRRLTEAEWLEIFTRGYWNQFRADEIASQSVAAILVDWLWMSGTTAIKTTQRFLGLNPDGIVGPKTIAAINAYDPSKLFGHIRDLREAHFREIVRKNPSQQVFLKGWMNRLNDLKYTA